MNIENDFVVSFPVLISNMNPKYTHFGIDKNNLLNFPYITLIYQLMDGRNVLRSDVSITSKENNLIRFSSYIVPCTESVNEKCKFNH